MDVSIVENESLARYTSWRIGGPARYFAEPTTPEALRDVLAWAAARNLRILTLGGGTNVLIRDAGFDGLVVRYRALDVRIDRQQGELLAWCGAGIPMAGTARRLARQGYDGLVWAEGLPGTMGGAVYGNAGCYGSDTASSITKAWLMVDGEVEEWPVERLAFGYRTSALKRMQHAYAHAPASDPAGLAPIVLAAEVTLREADPLALAQQMEQTAAARRSKTPSGQSCGSVFKNPPGDSAGRLIEAAGLKGTRIGNAQIADRHANYIVNLSGATADDVLRLTDRIQSEVQRQTGITLELEVQVIGE